MIKKDKLPTKEIITFASIHFFPNEKNLKSTNKLIYAKTFDINVHFLQIKMKTFKIKLRLE